MVDPRDIREQLGDLCEVVFAAYHRMQVLEFSDRLNNAVVADEMREEWEELCRLLRRAHALILGGIEI